MVPLAPPRQVRGNICKVLTNGGAPSLAFFSKIIRTRLSKNKACSLYFLTLYSSNFLTKMNKKSNEKMKIYFSVFL